MAGHNDPESGGEHAGARDVSQRATDSPASRFAAAAPGMAASFVSEVLRRAIEGVGPLTPAAAAADKAVTEQRGNTSRGIDALIEAHVRLAGGQGLLTNLGGLVTMAIATPANITGLAVIQCRLVAGIAHLRGHDLDDPRVRNALLTILLGEKRVEQLITEQKLPAPPMALATAPVHDPSLEAIICAEVAAEFLGRVAGKRVATVFARRVPLVGGVVGAGTDGYATWQVGRYADRELLPRARR